jgi:hypothetical protein
MIFISFDIEPKSLFTAEARRRGVKNLSYDSLSQNRHVEIDDESNRLVQQLQIGEELCFMDGENSLNALQLENYDILDDQIKAITTVEGHAFVDNRYGDLPLKSQSSEVQLTAEAFFVY